MRAYSMPSNVLLINLKNHSNGNNSYLLNKLRNVDELTSTSRRTDLGQICSISDHKN